MDDMTGSQFEKLLADSIASFQLTSTYKHQTGQTELIPVPQEPAPSAQIGDVAADQDVYVVGPAAITTYAKISGTAGETKRGDKVAITYTYPDGTTNGNLVYPTKDGYFEALLALDRDSPRGTYEALASLNNRLIGIVTFEVTDRQSEPVPPPAPPAVKDSDGGGADVDAEIPVIVREGDADVDDDDAQARRAARGRLRTRGRPSVHARVGKDQHRVVGRGRAGRRRVPTVHTVPDRPGDHPDPGN